MLLFQKKFHEGLISGAITLSFRRWQKPRVKPGGRYRCHPIGVLEVDSVNQIQAGEIPDEDARRAGFADRAALLTYLREITPDLDESTPLFRIGLRYGGDGDRVQAALDANLSREEADAISARLRKLDEKSPTGPWTRQTLALIRENPQVAASKLAAHVGREKFSFKADVVKLKKLGLTQSFEVGYEISPRGRAYLDLTRKK